MIWVNLNTKNEEETACKKKKKKKNVDTIG